MADAKLERTLAALPPNLREEVEDFAAFLLARRVISQNDATGEAHPLADLVGAWRSEPLADKDLLPSRSLGRDVDLWMTYLLDTDTLVFYLRGREDVQQRLLSIPLHELCTSSI